MLSCWRSAVIAESSLESPLLLDIVVGAVVLVAILWVPVFVRRRLKVGAEHLRQDPTRIRETLALEPVLRLLAWVATFLLAGVLIWNGHREGDLWSRTWWLFALMSLLIVLWVWFVVILLVSVPVHTALRAMWLQGRSLDDAELVSRIRRQIERSRWVHRCLCRLHGARLEDVMRCIHPQ